MADKYKIVLADLLADIKSYNSYEEFKSEVHKRLKTPADGQKAYKDAIILALKEAKQHFENKNITQQQDGSNIENPEAAVQNPDVTEEVDTERSEVVGQNGEPVEKSENGTTQENTTQEQPNENETVTPAEGSTQKPEPQAPVEEEKPKLSKYEIRAQKAQAALHSAQVDLLKIEARIADAKEKQAQYEKELAEKTKGGKVSKVALAKEAKKYDKLLDQLQAQIEKVGKLQDVADRAIGLSKSMNELKRVYSDISKSNEASKEKNQKSIDSLNQRGKSEDNTIGQKRRLSLSSKKMGRMMLVGAISKSLITVPAKKLSFVLRRMGRDDLAEKLEDKVTKKVENINKDVDDKVSEEFTNRTEIEDKVDEVSKAAKESFKLKADQYTSKSANLDKWRQEKRNSATPFIGLLSKLAAGRQEAKQSKALDKYKRAINRTQKSMERKIARGKDQTKKEDLKEEFADNTKVASGKFDSRINNESKVFKFVDKGNKIRSVLDRAREGADIKRQREMDYTAHEVSKLKEQEDQDKNASLGTKFKYKLAQRGRNRRLQNMRLGYEEVGSTRKTAANIAAFLGLKDAAIKINTSAVRSQRDFVENRMDKVKEGSRLEQIALNVGKGTIDAPIIAGKAVAGAAVMAGVTVAKTTTKAVDDARTFVENVREENASTLLDNVDKKEKAVFAQLRGVMSEEDRARAQAELEKEAQGKTNSQQENEIGEI